VGLFWGHCIVVVVVVVVVIGGVAHVAGYYAMLPSASQSDLSNLHHHLLDIKTLVSTMSATATSTSTGIGAAAAASRQSDDRLLVTVRQSNDSSTL